MHISDTKTTVKTDPNQAEAMQVGSPYIVNSQHAPLWSHGSLPLQTSLKINTPGDKYEQEADRVAEQVMRMPNPQLQRATCSCGKPMGPDGECSACKQKKLGIQRMANSNTPQTTAPPIVHQVLQQPGRPLDGATRNFMESRFGQDFGHVRVHTGGMAAESADAVHARAYTVGQNVVLGQEQHNIKTPKGYQLLAHELVHTLQQTGRGYDSLQRKDIPDYKGHVRDVSKIPKQKNFPGWTEVRACKGVAPPRGGKAYYKYCPVPLAPGTAVTVEATQAGGSWLQVRHPPVDRLGGQTLGFTPALYIEKASSPSKKEDIKPKEQAEPEDPRKEEKYCGPDVTTQVKDTVADTKKKFRGLSNNEKEISCEWLLDSIYGLIAWDIRPLHQHKWIRNDYGPKCATPPDGSGACCHRSVQVGNQCYYAGSVNYVIFGAMCKECFDFYVSISDIYGAYEFTDDYMNSLIDLYKGGGVVTNRSGNFKESQQWATAGYLGWPAGGTPPKGDCAQCLPCPQPYHGRSFDTRWCPYIDPKNACPKSRLQVIEEETR